MINKPSFKSLLISSLASSALTLCSCDSLGDSGFSSLDDHDHIHSDSVTAAVSGMGVNPEFQPTVDRFVEEANKRGVSVNLDGLDMQYGFTNGALGVCSSLVGNTKDIVLDPSLAQSSRALLDEIIIHELGHCILGRDHTNNPESIMHPTIIIGQPWRVEVLDELFSL